MPEKEKPRSKPKKETNQKQEKPVNRINIFADIFPKPSPKVNIQVEQDIYHRLENKLKEMNLEPKQVRNGIIFVAAAAATTALIAGGIKYKHDRDRKKEEAQKPIELTEKQKEEFKRLTELHYSRIYRYIDFRLAGNTHEAEDLTQKVFENAYRNYGKFLPNDELKDLDDPFYFWIIKIAGNLTKNWYRDHSCRDKKIAPLEQKEEEENSNLQTTIYNNVLPLQQKIEIGEEVLNLYNQVSNLNEQEKLIVFLTTFENERFTNAELGEILGKSEQAVKNIKNRMKKKINL